MGRRKSVYNEGDLPVFRHYKNRKTYFSNASKYVSHDEIREIIAKSSVGFDVFGIERDKFLVKVLVADNNMNEVDVLHRAICNGGFVSYIKKLEAKSVESSANETPLN
jgi:hypothetical protein